MGTILRDYARTLALLGAALVAVVVVTWVAHAIEDRRTPSPVKAARNFLEAVSRGTLNNDKACERALSHLTSSSRARFEAQARSADRWRSAAALPCRTAAARSFFGLRPDTARLAWQTGDRATIAIQRHAADPKSFLVPGFWPTRYIVTATEMHLTKEAGQWKVVAP
jgi:hypothetical protein